MAEKCGGDPAKRGINLGPKLLNSIQPKPCPALQRDYLAFANPSSVFAEATPARPAETKFDPRHIGRA